LSPRLSDKVPCAECCPSAGPHAYGTEWQSNHPFDGESAKDRRYRQREDKAAQRDSVPGMNSEIPVHHRIFLHRLFARSASYPAGRPPGALEKQATGLLVGLADHLVLAKAEIGIRPDDDIVDRLDLYAGAAIARRFQAGPGL